jgi:hypothetical protein
LLGSLFTKKEESKPVMVAPVPVAAPKPAVATPPAKSETSVLKPLSPVVTPLIQKPLVAPVTPVIAKPVGIQLKVEQKAVAKPEANAPEKGNIFTKLFGQEEVKEGPQKPATSVLETIVAKTAPSKLEAKKEKVPEENTGEMFLKFAGAFLRFSIAFIVISAAFMYVENLDTQNNVLALVKWENNAIQLHNASMTLDDKAAKVKQLNEEIDKYKGGYVDENQQVISKIIANRMDWPTILQRLNDVTESVYEKNAISQYVQYNNYSYNGETSQLTVSGTLTDPLGKNLTKLAELEQAFENFPRDPTNPSDDRKPYFYGLQEFKSFSKTFNSSTGRFQSHFTLTLYTKETKK